MRAERQDTHKDDEHGPLGAKCIGNGAGHGGPDCAAADGRGNQARAELVVLAEVFGSYGKDDRVADAFKEECQEEARDPALSKSAGAKGR